MPTTIRINDDLLARVRGEKPQRPKPRKLTR